MRLGVLLEQCRAPVPGGTARYSRELTRALLRTKPTDDVLSGWLASSSGLLSDLNVSLRSLHIQGQVLSRLWERGIGPKPKGVDVLHAPTLLLPPSSRRYGLVVTIHDVVPWTHPETLTLRGVRFHQRMGARAAREADVIVTPTKAVAGAIRDMLQPQCAVISVPPGTTHLFQPSDSADRRRHLGLGERPYVLFVGTEEPRKGLDILVEALSLPPLRGAQLVTVGRRGWGKVNVMDLADRNGVAGQVMALGNLNDLDLAAVYAGAAVFAMPSRAEGFGLPLLEAMAHDVPVVTSDDPALVEVVGDAGLVTPIGNAEVLAVSLAEVLTDQQLAAHLVQSGRLRSAKFDWDTTASTLWRVYADVFRRRSQ